MHNLLSLHENNSCGQAVQIEFTNYAQVGGVITTPQFWTNIVPSMWVIMASYTQLIRKLLRSLFSFFTTVKLKVIQLKHIACNYVLLLNYILIRSRP